MDLRNTGKRFGSTVPVVVAFVVVSIGLLPILGQANWQEIGDRLRQTDLRWIAVAVFFDVLSYVAQGARWRALLDGSHLWHTTRAIYAGLFLNEVLPFRPGEVVRGWVAAHELKSAAGPVIRSMLTERVLDAIWLTLAVLAALTLAPCPAIFKQSAWALIMVVVVVVAALAVVSRSRRGSLDWLWAGVRHPSAMLFSGAALAGQGVAFWATAMGARLHLNLLAAFTVMLVVRVCTLIPTTPANVGTHQLATIFALSFFGIPTQQATAFSILVFVTLTVPLFILGLAACLTSGVTWMRVKTALRPVASDPETRAPSCA